MSRWLAGLAAGGICAYVTIALWTERTGGQLLHVADLAASLAAAMLVVLVAWLLAGRLTRDPDRRGLIALVAGLWSLAFGTFQILAAADLHAGLRNAWAAVALWTVICALLLWVIARSRTSVSFVARAAAIAAVVLLGREATGAVGAAFRSVDNVVVAGPGGDATLPDVYVLVLDKYSSGAWLRYSYGVDQSAFEDSLRALGFAVPAFARANYAHTQLSLASFLNWSYLEDEPGGELSWVRMGELIRSARAWEAFRERGYRVVAFPTTFSATRSFPEADVMLRPPAIRPTRLPMTFLSNSPFAGVISGRCVDGCGPLGPTPYPVELLDDVEWKLAALEALPGSGGPTFAFLHLLLPHEPYLFGSDCSPRQPWWPLGDQGPHFGAVADAYADQVRCLAPLLLGTVSRIVQRSVVPPVIVLQSDHGHGRISVDPLRGFTLTSGELSPEQIGDRLGVFAAYRFPGADSTVREEISPVNVLPLILASLTGARAELQPDRSYWSSYQSAFSFEEVAADLTRPVSLPQITRTASAYGDSAGAASGAGR